MRWRTFSVSPPDQVSVVTIDVLARWVMEGGHVLPEPGDEAAWLAKPG